jgi:flagellar hook-length control protein FliK
LPTGKNHSAAGPLPARWNNPYIFDIYIIFLMARSLLRTDRIKSAEGTAVLSVSTETAVHSQQGFLRTKGTADQANAPTAGFSSLVDSNTEAATSSRDDGGRQSNDQPAANRGDEANSAPSTDVAHARGKVPVRGVARATVGTDSTSKANADSNQQEPADSSAPADPSASADASAVIAEATTAHAVAQGAPEQGNSEDKTTTKADATADGSTTDATRPTPAEPPTALIIAVVAQVAMPSSTTPATSNTGAGRTSVTAVSSAPGAIAAAAASKVAADVAATEPAAPAQPETTVVQGQSIDAKSAMTDQVEVIATAQPSASQLPAPTATEPDSVETFAVQGDAAALAQAVSAAQTPALLKTDAPIPSPAKSKATSPITDAKAAIDKNQQAVIDPQSVKVATIDDTKTADSVAPKKAASTIQAHDTSDQPVTKVQTDADASAAVPTVHQHATVETRLAQPSTLGAADLSNANAAQAAAANAATATTPAPAATAALNTANLTVLTGQAVPLSGLAVEISANAKAGNSRFEIRLDPPDLGRIDVRLDVDKNGQVTSRLFVEKSETLDLLRRDAPQLQQALQDAGLKTSDSGLQFSLRDQNPQQGRNNDNNSGDGQSPQRLVIAEDDAATANAAGRSYGRSLSASGGVDIRV